MGCLSVSFSRVGGISSSFTRGEGGISTKVTRLGGIETDMVRVGGIQTEFQRIGGLSCRVYMECSTNIRKPYLEISPEIVWVLAGWTSNDVYSNTNWKID